MTALYVILIVLAVLVLLSFLPLGAHILYDEQGVLVWAVAGLVQVRVYPPKPKTEEAVAKAEKKKQKKEEKKAGKAKKNLEKKIKKEKPKKSTGALLREFLPLVKVGIRALGDLRGVFTVQKLTVRVTYGGGDAAAVAMNYGIAWSVVSAAMALLTGTFRIKEQDVQAELDYNCREVRVTADACVTVTLARILGFAVHYGLEALRVWKTQKRKGGVTK